MLFSKKSSHVASLILLLIFFMNCSTVRVPYQNNSIPIDEAKSWNERAKLKKIDIHLVDGRVLQDRESRIRSNEVVYVENGDYKTLDLKYIKELHFKPQISSSFYLGLGLLAISSYLFYDVAQSGKNETGDSAGGILIPFALTAGSGYFFYQGLETKTTILVLEKE